MLQYIGALLYLAGSIGVLHITEPYKNTCGILWKYCVVFLILVYICAICNILRKDNFEKLAHRLFLFVLLFLLIFGYCIIGLMKQECFDFYRDNVPSLLILFVSSLGSLSFFSIRFIIGKSYL